MAKNLHLSILVTKSSILGKHCSRSGVSFISLTMYRISWAKVFRRSVTSRIDTASELSITDFRFSHSIWTVSHSPYVRKTFMTSSPRWLMTLTAMRPEAGLGKGREVSLWRVAQASGSISAFRVALRDL